MECLRGLRRKKTPKEPEPPEEEERTLKDEMRELFRLFDSDNDRTMSPVELGKAMKCMGMSPTEEDIEAAVRTFDINENGKIEFQEFFAFMQSEMAKLEESGFVQNEEVIRSAFRTFDKDGNGFIDADELSSLMQKLGETLTDQELKDMMKEADVDGDGRLNYEEFVKVWSGEIS